MAHASVFGEVLEAVDRLPFEDQEALVLILQRRVAEQGRKRAAAEVREARQEFAKGACRPVAVSELMSDLFS